MGPQINRAPAILEKDVWICWTLQQLFQMPDRPPMAFKGGTSLSKVFKAIARFSEDLDITLDYRGFNPSFDPFDKGVSKTQLKKLTEALRTGVRDYTHEVIVPYIREAFMTQFGLDFCHLEVDETGEQLRIYYPNTLELSGGYIGNSVLVEFGGRNITEPNELHEIRPDIAECLPGLDFPVAHVNVLAPTRTFWEKATLVHVECHRPAFRVGAQRLSRHWYDLFMLADQKIGQQALADRSLLAQVVEHKKVFYYTAYAYYDACLAGKLRLLPDKTVLSALDVDFNRMCDTGMFMGEPPKFEHLVERLRLLEQEINCSLI